MFDLFFSCNCRKDISKQFNINQRANLVTMGKTFDQSGLVFPDSFADIVCQPDIQSARLVGYNVNVVSSASRHTSIIWKLNCEARFLHFGPLRGPSVEMTTQRFFVDGCISCRALPLSCRALPLSCRAKSRHLATKQGTTSTFCGHLQPEFRL